MKSTTKIVVLTTQTENELKVNDTVRGTLQRHGQRTYQFTQRKAQRDGLPEELCRALASTRHGQIYANGYGVSVHLYVKHDKYNSPKELTVIIQSEVKELCKQLQHVSAVELLTQIKQEF